MIFEYSSTHATDLTLRDTAETSVKVQVLSARQQLVNGIKLGTVTHVLMDIQDVGENTKQTEQSAPESLTSISMTSYL